jgi:UPF0755 protein
MMKIIRAGLALLFMAVLLVSGGAFWLQNKMHNKVSHNQSGEFITIERGSTPDQIMAQLHQVGIISSPFIVKVYLRTVGEAQNMQAGEYQFPSPISAIEVLELLKKGRKRSARLTIPEGWTRFEIADRIANDFPVEPSVTQQEVLNMMNNTRLINDFDPDARNLEGYLYPTTYEFTIGTPAEDIIEKMVQQFRDIWEPNWTQRAKTLGRTPQEIVTIASLIENESKVDEERKRVASVIYNRLDRRMALGIDATNVYIAKMLGRWDGIIHKSDVEIDHPYNTRKIIGLPPGPISSASRSAYEAALYPEKTDYIFYVLDVDKNDGSHNFYETAAGFSQGKAKYQRWLAKQR